MPFLATTVLTAALAAGTPAVGARATAAGIDRGAPAALTVQATAPAAPAPERADRLSRLLRLGTFARALLLDHDIALGVGENVARTSLRLLGLGGGRLMPTASLLKRGGVVAGISLQF